MTVSGGIGRNDAAALSRRLCAVLAGDPVVVVVDISRVQHRSDDAHAALEDAAARARAAGIGFHLVDLADPASDHAIGHRLLTSPTAQPSIPHGTRPPDA